MYFGIRSSGLRRIHRISSLGTSRSTTQMRHSSVRICASHMHGRSLPKPDTDKSTPILEKLRAVRKRYGRNVILIDDADHFVGGDYPTISEIVRIGDEFDEAV